MDLPTGDLEETGTTEEIAAPRLRDLIWTPWYAKLWWSLIPIYWAGMALWHFLPQLGIFYSTALAGVVNVFMFPPATFIVLAAGYVRLWMETVEWTPRDPNDVYWHHHDRVSYMANPQDPRSGALWVHSPANIQNIHGRKH